MATNHSVGERDWYRVLGVDRQAGGDTIRVAYRELAWRLHPDRQQSPAAAGSLSHAEQRVAERRMREVNEAFRVLGEPARRRAYDHGRFGAETPKRPSRSATGRAERPRRTVVEVPDDHGDDMVDVAGDGVMQQEREFLAALETATLWTVQDGMLDMHRADGERVLTANPVAR